MTVPRRTDPAVSATSPGCPWGTRGRLTGALGVGRAREEDGDEPLERVLVHRVDDGEVGDAEEEDLRVDGDRDVEAARLVDVLLRLLGDHHLRLRGRGAGTRRGSARGIVWEDRLGGPYGKDHMGGFIEEN